MCARKVTVNVNIIFGDKKKKCEIPRKKNSRYLPFCLFICYKKNEFLFREQKFKCKFINKTLPYINISLMTVDPNGSELTSD